MKYTKEQLYEIIVKNDDEEVVRTAFEFGKKEFDKVDLTGILKFCRLESVVKEAWDIGKEQFNNNDLSVIWAFCKFESIKNKAKQKLRELEE